jgi:hypothetical protein
MRLAAGAHDEAHRCLIAMQQQWLELIGTDIGEDAAKAVLCIRNGRYFNAIWEQGPSGNATSGQGDAEQLLPAVERLTAPRLE